MFIESISAKVPYTPMVASLATPTEKGSGLYCFRCGHSITQEPDFVSDGYAGACLKCDEDMFSFEIIVK